MSAPFELLVAVIIMSFVMIVGSQMLAASNKEVCVNSIEKEMSKFKDMLEDTATRQSSNRFIFDNPNDCYDEKNAIIKIEKVVDNPKRCSAICATANNTCFIMLFVITKAGIGKEKCLNLSQYTSFITEGCDSSSDDLAGYKAIDPTQKLNVGSYVLRNMAKAGETYPKICTYYSVSGK